MKTKSSISGGKKKFPIANIAFGVLTLLALVWGTTKWLAPTRPNAEPSSVQEAKLDVRLMIDSDRARLSQFWKQYLAHHQMYSNSAWLTASFTKEPDEWFRQVSKWEAETQQALNQYQDTSEFTKILRKHYSRFKITHYEAAVDNTRFVHPPPHMIPPGSYNPNTPDILEQFELAIVTPNEAAKRNLPGKLYYRPSWGAIMVTGVTIPQGLRAALFYHELGHAYKHQIEKAASSTAPSNSDLYADEEVVMHSLETDVLDEVSSGKLRGIYSKIIDRARLYKKPSVLSAVEWQDLVEYDRVIGASEVGYDLATLTATQFFMGLLLYSSDHGEGIENRLSKRDLYRWITSAAVILE